MYCRMKKLMELDVMIVGLKASGVEVAKNVILGNPKSVTLFDPTPVEASDLGSNFYLSAEDIGKSRAEACGAQLADLNGFVKVSTLNKAELEDGDVDGMKVVVFTDGVLSTERVAALNARIRAAGGGTVLVDTFGAAGRMFVDFGDEFLVSDLNGERTLSYPVVDVVKGSEETEIVVDDSKRLGLEVGDFVVFKDFVKGGCDELNELGPVEVTHVGKSDFKVGVDSSSFSDFYPASCYVEQAKVPTKITHASLEHRLENPIPTDGDPASRMWTTPDFGKFDRPPILHVAFRAVDAYRAAHDGAFPPANDAAAAEEVVAFAREIAGKASEEAQIPTELSDEHAAVVRGMALHSAAQLQPLASFFGGIAAQEVVKHTGKFTPFRQWLYLDAFDALPPVDGDDAPSAESRAPKGDRYDHLRAMLGQDLVSKLQSRRVFLVGSGALGCEFLKSFCMLGVGCGGARGEGDGGDADAGYVTVTDMDQIEVSNLNRQFLFRQKDVGQPKSSTAAAAARAMNPDLRVEAITTPVGTDTESTFNDRFWEGIDVVVNALDNVKARLYVDSQCVWYRRPLLESGTLGTKANTQVVVPGLTESYGDSRDPPEESVPMCTLKNFPNQIEHCIEWSRGMFFDLFTAPLQDCKAFLEDKDAWFKTLEEEQNVHARRSRLEATLSVLRTAKEATFASCVEDAVRTFTRRYDHDIRQLLHNFPKNHVSASTGLPFWSGSKRAPDPEVLDVDGNELHRSFIAHHAALRAANFGVPVPEGFETATVLAPLVARVDIPPFEPKKVKIETPEEEKAKKEGGGAVEEEVAAAGGGGGEGDDGEDDLEAIERLKAELVTLGDEAKGVNVEPAVFEKDEDSNFHVAWMTDSSNLRASNYKIKTATFQETKIIAGKVIPALATTTCAVTGLVAIEMLKVLQDLPVEAYRNTFMNLAVNVFAMSEPMPPKKVTSTEFDPILAGPLKAVPEGFTPWDRVIIDEGRDLTVKEFCEKLSEVHHGVTVDMISIGESIIYWPSFHASHKEREDTPLAALIAEHTDFDLEGPKSCLAITVNCTDPTDFVDVAIPRVQYFFRAH